MNGKAIVERNEHLQMKFNEKRITLFDHSDKEHVIIAAKRMADRAGFDETNQCMIATAASEVATNIMKYAKGGEVILRIVKRESRLGIKIIARDEGPGIRDIEQVMQDNFSTSKGSLGLGLPSVQRIMDEFKIESQPGLGTTVSAIKWR